MPRTPQRPLARRGLAFIVISSVLALSFSTQATPVGAAGGSDAKGWQARQARNMNVPKRDRELVAGLPGQAKLGYHPQTGRVRFISGTPSLPLSGGVAGVASGKRKLSGADARSKARRFVDRYGQLFGLESPAIELRAHGTTRKLTPASGVPSDAAAGLPNATVRFEQVRGNVPVMGGEIVVQLSEAGEVLSAAGEVLPSGAKATTSARIGAGRAQGSAGAWLARFAQRRTSAVSTRSEGLALYEPGLMDDPTLSHVGTRLVWRVDARVAAVGKQPAHERLVLVDALDGQVLTSINRLHSAEGPVRRVCDNRNIAGRSLDCRSPYARSEGQAAVGISDVDSAYRLMGATYDYFFDRFGRDGIDGTGSAMKATVRYCPSYGCPWNNAEWKWSKQQAVFGKGWAQADDIVGHEFTHGVLDAEAPLFYHYQSGAINESYADVFGELIDLSYPGGKDTSWTKWKIGEDTPRGVFRDMKDPPRYGHPDRVRSSKWFSGSSDDGGVHRNSGVGNKTAYLMAAGGSFHGYTVKSIGQTRTARVWYQALTTRLTPAANYVDLADALVSACTDLAGTEGMTLAHCKSVRDATRATEMNLVPKRLAPKTAPVCGSGKTAAYVFKDDLEDTQSGNWQSSTLVGTKKGWYYPQNPNDGTSWDGTWASSGKYNLYAPNRSSRSDATMRMSGPVVLPKRAFLRFGHGYSFDYDPKRRYDGGVVEVRVDGGPWRSVGGLFTHGGYNGRIASNYGNPLAGRKAWTGNSRGWAKTRIDLSKFAGSRVKVRFRTASDRTVGGQGWYIDDIRIYTCADDSDKPTGTLTIAGGSTTTTDTRVTLSLSWADATTWVTRVRLSGSAKMEADGVQLLKGISMPIRDSVAWDLADTTYGGSGGLGLRRVYAQVRDAAGNWSDVFSDEIELLAP